MKIMLTTILFLLLQYYPCYGQIINLEWIDFNKTYLPPVSNSIENFKKYEIIPNVDSLKKYYIIGDRTIHYKQFLNSIKYIRHKGLFRNKRFVRKNGEFTIYINMGPLTIFSDSTVRKLSYSNIHSIGYVKEVFYSLPLSVSVFDNDSTILFKNTIRDNLDTLYYRVTNRYDENKVFYNLSHLNNYYTTNLNNLISEGYSIEIQHEIINLIERYFHENKLDFSLAFYMIKNNPRYFDYTELDSAFTLLQKGLNLFKNHPCIKSKYYNLFKQSLTIHMDAYQSEHLKITFDIKNALAYNIAVINYFLGNYEEAEKYKKLHNNKSGIFKITKKQLDYLANSLPFFGEITN